MNTSKPSLLDQAGNTLTMVILSSGAMLMVGYSMLQMSVTSQMASEGLRLQSSFYQLLNQLNSMLQVESSCRVAIGWGPLTSTYVTLPQVQTFVRNTPAKPVTLYALKSGLPVQLQPYLAASTIVGPTAPATSQFGGLTITKLELRTPNPAPSPVINSKNNIVYDNLYLTLHIEATKPRIAGSTAGTTSGAQVLTSDSIRIAVQTQVGGAGLQVGNGISSCSSMVFTVPSDATPHFLPTCNNGYALYTFHGNSLGCVKTFCDPGYVPSLSEPKWSYEGNRVCVPGP